jgi:hypothetical protein
MEIVSESFGRQLRDIQNSFLETHNLEFVRRLARWLAAAAGAATCPSTRRVSGGIDL